MDAASNKQPANYQLLLQHGARTDIRSTGDDYEGMTAEEIWQHKHGT
jgi:hypothetical protein